MQTTIGMSASQAGVTANRSGRRFAAKNVDTLRAHLLGLPRRERRALMRSTVHVSAQKQAGLSCLVTLPHHYICGAVLIA